MTETQPDLFGEATAHHRAGRMAEAETGYRNILRSNPQHLEALILLGTILMTKNDLAGAAQLLSQAIALNPNLPQVHNDLGITFNRMKRYEDALAAYDRALALMPDFADAHNNRANALRNLRRYEEAIEAYKKTIALKPNFAQAYYNYGLALQELRRFDEALALYDRAIQIEPQYADALWNKGFIKLITGNFAEGWPLYEWRWKRGDFTGRQRSFGQPLWRGEEIKGKTILLHAEQGLGDTIHFSRYASMLAARGATIILEVQPGLKQLMTGLKDADRVIAQGEPLPVFDYHCPMASLPLAFKTDLASIPAEIPYLKASDELVTQWRGMLAEKRGLRVGIVWAGNPDQNNDRNRSMSLFDLMPLMDTGVELISLQKDMNHTDRIMLGALPIKDIGSKLQNFSDTAAVIASLDLVISVCTSVAHLAGAMGKPLWILLSHTACWRWLLEREHSPWYPTARLFRQNSMGNWKDVIQNVADELRKLDIR